MNRAKQQFGKFEKPWGMLPLRPRPAREGGKPEAPGNAWVRARVPLLRRRLRGGANEQTANAEFFQAALFRWAPAPWIGVALTAGLLVVGGCSKSEGETNQSENAVPITKTTVAKQTLKETVRGVGTLQAAAQVEVRPEIAGRVIKVGFEEGGRVESDQVLIQLDRKQLTQEVDAKQAERDAAQARLKEAKNRAERFKSLVQTNAVSRDEYEGAQTDYEAAQATGRQMEAELQRDQERLDDTTIEAPFDGLISEADVDVGDYVDQGEKLATLYRTDTLEVSFTLPERYTGRVQSGQSVDARVSAYPDRTFEGKVTYVSPSVDEQTRDFRVKAKIANKKNLLKPGTFATAVVTVDVRKDRPVVPEAALVATRNGYILFVIGKNKQVKRREVKVGLRKPGVAEILQGVSVGEPIVRSGQINLAEGKAVRIAETRPLQGTSGGSGPGSGSESGPDSQPTATASTAEREAME